MSEASGLRPEIVYGPPRQGDVRHSRADVTAARNAFGFEPSVGLEQGLSEYLNWAKGEIVCSAIKL